MHVGVTGICNMMMICQCERVINTSVGTTSTSQKLQQHIWQVYSKESDTTKELRII